MFGVTHRGYKLLNKHTQESSLSHRYFKIILLTFLGISTFTLYTVLVYLCIRPQTIQNIVVQSPSNSISSQHDYRDDPNQIARSLYINQYADSVNFDLEGPFDGTALGLVCSSRKVQPGLYFQCQFNYGGLSNVRNMVLTCVRYALAAGASGLILPQIEKRGKLEIGSSNLLTNEFKDFDYLYDTIHFKNSMWQSCPSMKIYDSLKEIPNYGWARVPDVFDPKDLDPWNPDRNKKEGKFTNRRNLHAKTFRYDFDKHLNSDLKLYPSVKQPIIIRLSYKHLYQYPINLDSTNFINTFGRLIKFNPDTRAMASVIVSRLLQNTSSLSITSELLTGYMGLHIRSEPDVPRNWMGFDYQAQRALELSTQHDLRHVYLATGQETEFFKLREMARPHNISIESKWTVLTPQEVGWLKELTFDQMAEVDYLVLLMSQRFVGLSTSSFSAQLALKRHIFIQGESQVPWKHPQDSLSFLHGEGFEYPDMVWP